MEICVYFLVFMSPESTQDKSWREIFHSKSVFKKRLSILAVDEAHCISEWFVIGCNEMNIILELARILF